MNMDMQQMSMGVWTLVLAAVTSFAGSLIGLAAPPGPISTAATGSPWCGRRAPPSPSAAWRSG